MNDTVSFVLLISTVIFVACTIVLFISVRRKDVQIGNLKNQFADDEKLRAENHKTRKENVALKEANEELNGKIIELSSRMLILSNIAGSLGSSLDPKDIYNSVVIASEKLLDAKRCSVLLLDRTGQFLTPKVARGWTREEAHKTKVKPTAGIIGWVMANKRLITAIDVEKDYRLASLLKEEQHPSIMCAPVFGQEEGEMAGVLNVEELKGKEMSKEQIRLFSILANLTTLSIRNSTLFKKTEQMANVDGLTKLYNNRFFQQFLDEELKRSQRYKHKVSVVMTDIDHFKNFNDKYGHQIGDLVLEETAKVFKRMIRQKVDLVARYGGEEFISVLPETDLEGAKIFAERLRQAVEAHSCINPESGEKLSITVSVGVATFPDHTNNRNELIRMADESLLKAKELGRNVVVVYPLPDEG